MKSFHALCAFLSATVLNLARLALAGLGLVVIYGVIQRYAFNDSPPYIEQVALILVISVAMFGAAAGARDGGHIGLDSVVKLLPRPLQKLTTLLVDLLSLGFAGILLAGSVQMGWSTQHDTIPTLGISEAFRYLPLFIAALLIALFSVEHMLRLLLAPTDKASPWN
jgi:TRAP-type C4-dicarboxylate transport system permease small subunit